MPQTPKPASRLRLVKPVTEADVRDIAENQYDIDGDVAAELIRQESNYNPNARSKAGAEGLGQLMPGTAREMGVKNRRDPLENLHGSLGYYRKQLDAAGGDESEALRRYNGGPGYARRPDGQPRAAETRDYEKKIMGRVYTARRLRLTEDDGPAGNDLSGYQPQRGANLDYARQQGAEQFADYATDETRGHDRPRQVFTEAQKAARANQIAQVKAKLPAKLRPKADAIAADLEGGTADTNTAGLRLNLVIDEANKAARPAAKPSTPAPAPVRQSGRLTPRMRMQEDYEDAGIRDGADLSGMRVDLAGERRRYQPQPGVQKVRMQAVEDPARLAAMARPERTDLQRELDRVAGEQMAERERLANSWMPEPVNRFARSLLGTGASAIDTLETLSPAPKSVRVGNQTLDLRQADKMRADINRAFPADPTRQGFLESGNVGDLFVKDLPEAIGSAAAFAPAALAGGGAPAVSALLGALIQGGEGARMARQAGFGERAQFGATVLNSLAGLTEAAGIGGQMAKMGAMKPLLETVADLAEEAGQEAAQSFLSDLGNALATGQKLNPDELRAHLAENGFAGLLAGGAFQALAGVRLLANAPQVARQMEAVTARLKQIAPQLETLRQSARSRATSLLRGRMPAQADPAPEIAALETEAAQLARQEAALTEMAARAAEQPTPEEAQAEEQRKGFLRGFIDRWRGTGEEAGADDPATLIGQIAAGRDAREGQAFDLKISQALEEADSLALLADAEDNPEARDLAIQKLTGALKEIGPKAEQELIARARGGQAPATNYGQRTREIREKLETLKAQRAAGLEPEQATDLDKADMAAEKAAARERQAAEKQNARATERAGKLAEKDGQRAALYQEAQWSALEARQRADEAYYSGDIETGITELQAQLKAVGEASRRTPDTPEGLKQKLALQRQASRIGNEIGRWRQELRQQQTAGKKPATRPATQTGGALLDSAVNPEGGIPATAPVRTVDWERLAEQATGTGEDDTPRLTTFVRRMGGMAPDRDVAGELRRLAPKESGTTGLINRNSRYSPDDMLQMARGDGLTQAETVGEFLDELEAARRHEARAAGKAALTEGEYFAAQEGTDAETDDVTDFLNETAAPRFSQRAAETRAENPAPGARSGYRRLLEENRDLIDRMRKANLAGPDGLALVERLRNAVAEQGNEQRHVTALVEQIKNDQFREAAEQDQIARLTRKRDQLLTEIRQLQDDLPLTEADAVERYIMAAEAIREDADLMALLEQAGAGNEQAAADFTDIARATYGIDERDAADIIEGQQLVHADRQRRAERGRADRGARSRNRNARRAESAPAETQARIIFDTREVATLGPDAVARQLRLVADARAVSMRDGAGTPEEWANLAELEQALRERYRFLRAERMTFRDGTAMPSLTELFYGKRQKRQSKADAAAADIRGSGDTAGRDSGDTASAPRGGDDQRQAGDTSDVMADSDQAVVTAAEISTAAHEAATSPQNDLPEPTDGQKEAGNYKKGHIRWNGLDISIENPEGSMRSGTGPDGKPWSVTMAAHYGYIRRTEGADGDHVDIYMGDNPESDRVFIVDQIDKDTKEFDEHKVILGVDSREDATLLYDAHFSDRKGPQRRQAVTEIDVDGFKWWLKNGNTTRPFARKRVGLENRPPAASGQQSYRNMAEREQSAIANILDTFMDLGGITREQAGIVYDRYKKEKFLNFKETYTTGRIHVKHGSLLDRDVIRRAAGLDPDMDESSPTDVLKRIISDALDDGMEWNDIRPGDVANVLHATPSHLLPEMRKFLLTDPMVSGYVREFVLNYWIMPAANDFDTLRPGDVDRVLDGTPLYAVPQMVRYLNTHENPRVVAAVKAWQQESEQQTTSTAAPDAIARDLDNAFDAAFDDLFGATSETQNDTPAHTPVNPDADVIMRHFLNGGAFRTIVEARKFARASNPELTNKQIDELIELAGVMAAAEIAGRDKSAEATFDALVDLQSRMPSLNVRTSTSVEQQAYSTPLPLAWVAGQLAGITDDAKVYEPTAGNGALLIRAYRGYATANELNPDRASALRSQGFTVTENDAAIWAPAKKHDVVIANPPFGPVKDADGKTKRFRITPEYDTTEIDHAIAFKALEAMADNGRAVLIVGAPAKTANASDAYNGAAKRKFYFTLYNQYNVIDHFTVSGDLYKKQGAAWPVDVIVIDGRGKSARPLPAAQVPELIKSWEELKGKIPNGRSILDERQISGADRDLRSAETGTGQRDIPEPAGGQTGTSGVTNAGRPANAAGSDGGTRAGGTRRGGKRSGSGAQSGTGRTPDNARRSAGDRADKTGQSGSGAGVQGNQPGGLAGQPAGLSDVFDSAFKEVFGKAKDAGTEAVQGLDNVAKGLMELFGGNKLSSGLTFDEETYRKAKPLFQGAYNHFRASAQNVAEAMRLLLKALNEQYGMAPENIRQMKPYIVRFMEEQQAAPETTSKATAAAPTVKPPKAPQSSDTHEPYQKASSAGGLGTLVPRNLSSVTRSAMDAFEAEHGDPDDYIAEKLGYTREEITGTDGKPGYFSAEQVDAIALGIANVEDGRGFIIGDMTGVGKGRFVAAMIRYGMRTGKFPVFVTEKPTLYGDMIRDLTDIGMPDVKVFITNAGESVPLSDEALAWAIDADNAKIEGRRAPMKPSAGFLETLSGPKHRAEMERMIKQGAGEYRAIFTTYNQMQTVKGGERTMRHDLLERYARGGLVIMDESHNAGGGKVEVEGGEEKLTRASFARQLTQMAHGVVYSSATFAKRPEVMDLYSKTDLGLISDRPAELAEIIADGGVPLQQVISAMLTESGQYLRRERSFAGVEYATRPVDVDRGHAGQVSDVMAAIMHFDETKQSAVANLSKQARAEARTLRGDGSTGGAGMESTNFAAIMHNLIDQMLLSLKANAAADEAIASVRAGERAVITVANTMGSMIEQYTTEYGIRPGDGVGADFGSLLKRYLRSTRRVIEGDPYGKKVSRELTDEELGPAALAEYKRVLAMIDRIDFSGMPLSPIDWIHHRLEQAGIKSGEITGRSHTIQYGADGAVYKVRGAGETSTTGKKKAINGFNNGDIQVLILNQSGSTGISLHAHRDFANREPRHMIIAQAEKNVDTHMQMLGRVHRTAQVVTPRYSQLAANIPSEMRPAAVLARKMASLNANTTAARGSAVTSAEVVDFLNEYGNAVVAALMWDNAEIHAALGSPLALNDKGDGYFEEDAARKVSGRIPVLPLAKQEDLYARIIEEYKAVLAQAEAMGENALEAKTLPLKAETVSRQEISTASGDRPFQRAVTLERVDADLLGKPFTSAEVLTRLREHLGAPETATMSQIAALGKAAAARQAKEYEAAVDAHMDAYRERMLKLEDGPELLKAETGQMQAARLRWESLNRVLAPGASVQIASKGGVRYGIALKIERKKAAKKPLIPSAWEATILLSDSGRQIKLPLSRLTTDPKIAKERALIHVQHNDNVALFNQASGNFDRFISPLEAFDAAGQTTREKRWIATGNIVSAFAKLQEGQITNYTTADGEVRQGILMPRSWSPEKWKNEQPVAIETADQIETWISQGSMARAETADGDFRIKRDRGLIVIEAAAAKARGGKYYLNRDLRDIVGDLEKKGSVMQAIVDAGELGRVVDVLRGRVAGGPVRLIAAGNQKTARELFEAKKDSGVQARNLPPEWQTAKYVPGATRPEEVIEGIRVRYHRPRNRSKDGAVWMNQHAMRVITAVLNRLYGGESNVPAGSAISLTTAMKVAAEIDLTAARYNGTARDRLLELSREIKYAVSQTDQSGIALMRVDARGPFSTTGLLRHERGIHVAQQTIGRGLPSQAAAPEWIENTDQYETVAAYLRQLGYTDDQIPVEAPAFIAEGAWRDMGLAEWEAEDLLVRYFDAVKEMHGEDALNYFRGVGRMAQQALNDLRRQYDDERRNIRPGRNGQSGRADESSGRPGDSLERDGGNILFRREESPARGDAGAGAGNRTERGFINPFGSAAPSPARGLMPLADQPLQIDTVAQRDKYEKILLDAWNDGQAPGERAKRWYRALKMTGQANRVSRAQTRFIGQYTQRISDLENATQALTTATRGTPQYRQARRNQVNAVRDLNNMAGRMAPYTGPVDYLTGLGRAMIFTALHIPYFNIIEQLATAPLNQAAKFVNPFVPYKWLEKHAGIKYRDKASVPAMVAGLAKATFSIPKNVFDSLRAGSTDARVYLDLARELDHLNAQQGADKYQQLHRPRMVPGLDRTQVMIFRVQGAADVFGRDLVTQRELYTQAELRAREFGRANGLTEPQIAQLAQDLFSEPSAKLLELAGEAADRFIYDVETPFYRAIMFLRRQVTPEKDDTLVRKAAMAPVRFALDSLTVVVKIPAAAARALSDYSPLGLAWNSGRILHAVGVYGQQQNKVAQARSAGQNVPDPAPMDDRKAAELIERWRQGLLGTLVWTGAGLFGSALWPMFTGGQDDDDRQVANVQEALGEGYDSELQTDNSFVNISRLGIAGKQAAIASAAMRAARPRHDEVTGRQDGPAAQIGRGLVKAAEETANTLPVVLSVSRLRLGETPESKAKGVANFAAQTVAGKYVPGIAREVAKARRPLKLTAADEDQGKLLEPTITGMKMGIPGLRETLPPRLDALGREIPEPGAFDLTRPRRRDADLERMKEIDAGMSKPKREAGEPASSYNPRVVEQGARNKESMREVRAATTLKLTPDAQRQYLDREFEPGVQKKTERLSGMAADADRDVALEIQAGEREMQGEKWFQRLPRFAQQEALETYRRAFGGHYSRSASKADAKRQTPEKPGRVPTGAEIEAAMDKAREAGEKTVKGPATLPGATPGTIRL